MARGDDIERLLGEVEQFERGGSGSRPVAKQKDEARLSRVEWATLGGAVAAGAVFLLFAFLPFFGAISGAVGAFLGVFVALLLRRR